MTRYYDWQVVRELPLGELGGLLSYAGEKEIEKEIYPLWLVHFLISQLSGGKPTPYEELLSSVKFTVDATQKRSADEIIKDFAPIIEAYRQKGG